MDFTLKVIANQAQTVTKQERAPDGSIKAITEKRSRIVARDSDGNAFSFSMSYDEGKKFELDQEIKFSI
jgi:hypothetical protein